tara:strand:+ start:6443 stop:6676 length:234 start_codon:yes stop_codon:yes gene_type:complete
MSNKIEEYVWPPTEEQIKDIASSALNSSNVSEVKVLVYWDNPTIMILDPIHFSRTDYVEKKYTCDERSVEVIIGKLD